MASSQLDELSAESLLQGQVEVYHHSLCYLKSMAIRCADELGLPGAIHRRGGAATLSDLAAEAKLHPATLPRLRRLMRVLTVSGFFAASQSPSPGQGSSGEVVYALTPASRLLVGDRATRDLAACMRFFVHPTAVTPFFSLGGWFRGDGGAAGAGEAPATSLFEKAHGVARWEMTRKDAAYSQSLNDSMVGDSSFIMDIVLREGGESIFRGLTSLVDVGGGHGGAATAIARAFPHVKCTVMDLPQVISQAPTDGIVHFVAGNAFESIPPADAVLLKYVLDCWSDEDCVKVLRKCKEVIPATGKVIIIDVVVGYGSMDSVIKETQVLFDFYIMSIDGAQREEHEWNRIFLDAGFSYYKILLISSFISIMEVYP